MRSLLIDSCCLALPSTGEERDEKKGIEKVGQTQTGGGKEGAREHLFSSLKTRVMAAPHVHKRPKA